MKAYQSLNSISSLASHAAGLDSLALAFELLWAETKTKVIGVRIQQATYTGYDDIGLGHQLLYGVVSLFRV
jgi:hypothetical protein